MFGEGPSYAAQRALAFFAKGKVGDLLELGAGQGRDSLFFARRGLTVTCVDYSEEGLRAIRGRALREDLENRVVTARHDLHHPLPFAACSMDACYSHMLYCMDFTTAQLRALSAEVRRVLKPDGINVFTTRHTGDPHFGKGTNRGDGRFETGGYIVHFLGRDDIEGLDRSFSTIEIEEFEEGELPRKLLLVVQKKIF
jgi:SAM-dependent methyltransferase